MADLQANEPASIAAVLARQPDTAFAPGISAAQVAEFRERGFIAIERITSTQEIHWLGELYDLLFTERTQALPGGYFDLVRPYDSPGEDLQPQIIAPEMRLKALRRTAFWRNGRALAATLLGVDAAALRGWGHMIRKPPSSLSHFALLRPQPQRARPPRLCERVAARADAARDACFTPVDRRGTTRLGAAREATGGVRRAEPA